MLGLAGDAQRVIVDERCARHAPSPRPRVRSLPMTPRTMVLVAGLALFLGVGAGAFGAHALRSRIAPDLLVVFQTGVQYHLVHALGLLAIGILAVQWPQQSAPLAWIAWCMVAGLVLFCGSLYALALTGVRAFGALTPLGGLAWLAGWALLAWVAWRR